MTCKGCYDEKTGGTKCTSCNKHDHEALKKTNGWCDECKMGFKPDGSTTTCKMCHSGLTGKNVWCDGCKKGYVGGKAVKCKGCYTAKTGGPKCAT